MSSEDKAASFVQSTWSIIERKPHVNEAPSAEGAGKIKHILSYREY